MLANLHWVWCLWDNWVYASIECVYIKKLFNCHCNDTKWYSYNLPTPSMNDAYCDIGNIIWNQNDSTILICVKYSFNTCASNEMQTNKYNKKT